MDEETLYDFSASYTETITGEGYAKNPEALASDIISRLGAIPDFKINYIKETNEEENESHA